MPSQSRPRPCPRRWYQIMFSSECMQGGLLPIDFDEFPIPLFRISHFLFEEFLFLFFVQIYEELKKNCEGSCDHQRFEAKGGGRGGTLGREIEESDSVSVSVTTTTTTSVLSWITTLTLIREKTVMACEAAKLDYVRNYSICRPPFVLLPVEDNDGFIYSVETFGSDDDAKDYDDKLDGPFYGLPLLEVFSVVVNQQKPPGDDVSVYGTITVSDGFPSEYIYNRKKEDSESISSLLGDTTALLLTGPTRPISSDDAFFIEVALMDNNDEVIGEGKISWDTLTGTTNKDEGGKVSWNIHNYPTTSIYNKLLATNIDGGRSGSVTVNYIVFSDAVAAIVEVTLLNHRGNGAADVYGLIQAGSNCGSSTSTYWSVLFQKKKKNDEYIDVRPGQCIPLSRSQVAVDGSSSLNVSAELYDRGYMDLSQDYEIAKGTVVFPAQSSGTSEKNLSGRYGEILVKVTWTD